MDLKMNDALNKVWDQLVAKIEGNPGIWEKPWFMNAAGREELVAEIGSVFLKTETGINDKVDNAAAYIKNWWGNIKEDRGSLIDACGKAQKATNFILSSGERNS